ncbi:hypothetical protein [Motilimonas eburnea]|uniref:hypothetical protein n=1 Tax=Motilimonas eburnea TaxID=1737488 RepID=UPI001E53320B|nr:hypothetical protein [Motilimonas eburnea]MCE2572612.1 hypothetical protein [Motilimonas eburnea]
MHKAKKLSLALLTLPVSGLSFAQNSAGFSYSHIDLKAGLSPSALELNISKPLTPQLAFIGGFGSELDNDYLLDGGVRFHTPINASMDFILDGKANLSDKGKHASTNWGLEVLGGVRFAPANNIELNAQIGIADYGWSSQTKTQLGGMYQLTPSLSIGGQAEFNGFYGDQMMVIGRLAF